MNKIIFSGVLLACAFATPAATRAEPAPYLVLTPPAAAGYTVQPVQPVTKSAYSWGWFGSQPRSHTYGHTGYYGDRWKFRRR